jgi:flagellar motor switch protein FliG
LPERARSEVLRRLAESDDAHPEMLREVETALAARFQELDRQRRRRLRGQRTLAEILAAARKTAATETGDEPGSRPAPASRLPWRMGDLASLDDAPLAEVLGACDEDLLALALASVDPGTYARLTRVLRPHEIRWTDERLAGLGPLPLADLELAAAGLLATAARLERQGRIRRTTSTRPATAAA